MKNKIYLSPFISLLFLFLMSTCTKLETIQPCPEIVADFEVSIKDAECLSSCEVHFRAAKSYVTEKVNYHWDFGDGYTATTKNPIHYFEQSGTYLTKLVVSDAEDCKLSHTTAQTVLIKSPLVGSCITFNPDAIQLRVLNDNYQIVEGDKIIKDFASLDQEAMQAYRIIQHYGLTDICTIDYPNFEYGIVHNSSPIGNIAGEDCLPFNPNTIEVKFINNRWKIVDGSHWIFDFERKEIEARKAYNVIKTYGFTKICYIGRPYASFSYLRK